MNNCYGCEFHLLVRDLIHCINSICLPWDTTFALRAEKFKLRQCKGVNSSMSNNVGCMIHVIAKPNLVDHNLQPNLTGDGQRFSVL